MLLFNAAAILATLLTLGIAAQAARQRSFGLGCLAAWMATLAATAWVIVLFIDADRRLTPAAMLLIPLLSTPAGPLLYGYVLHAVQGRRLHWAWFLPFVAYLTAALIFGVELARWTALSEVIWLEYILLILSWVVWARAEGAVRDRMASGGVLVAVTLLHFANAAQTLAHYGVIDFTRLVRRGPFLVLCAWSLAAIAFALAESTSFRRLVPALARVPDEADRVLFGQLTALMRDVRPWTEPEFDVAALARLAGTHSNAVSRALSRAGATTFYDFVNRYRLQEAERLLADPQESRFKIEALGRQAGFRARSTFFKLFRQHTGLTPSEYRAARSGRPNG